MKKLISLTCSLLLLLTFNQSRAQETATQIAIIPFSGGNASITQAVQEQVANSFVNKKRYILLDRGVTQKLKAELEAAKSNASIYAKVVAENGKLAGAEYIITGTVSSLAIDATKLIVYVKKTQTTQTQYHGTLRVSLQINKVETGQVLFTVPLTLVSKDYASSAQTDILDNILCQFRNIVHAEVRKLFPAERLIIVSVESEKNGYPETVLINAGHELLDNGDRRSSCGDTFLGFTPKIRFDIFSITESNIGGEVLKREIKIGELKVGAVQGDFTVCKVVSGEKEIKTAMDEKKTIEVRMQ